MTGLLVPVPVGDPVILCLGPVHIAAHGRKPGYETLVTCLCVTSPSSLSMIVTLALLPLDVPEGEARAHKPQREEGPERLLAAQEGETQVGELIVGLRKTNISDLASEIDLRLTYLPPFPSK